MGCHINIHTARILQGGSARMPAPVKCVKGSTIPCTVPSHIYPFSGGTLTPATGAVTEHARVRNAHGAECLFRLGGQRPGM